MTSLPLEDIVGQETAVGFLQLLYDIIFAQLRKTNTEDMEQSFAHSKKVFAATYNDGTGEEDNINIVTDLNGGCATVDSFTNSEVSICANVIKNDKMKLKIRMSFQSDYDDFEIIAESLAVVMKYGVPELQKNIVDKVKKKFDGLVNKKWLFSFDQLKIEPDLTDPIYPLVFDFIFDLIDEAALRVGGEEYQQAEKRYKKSEAERKNGTKK